MATPINILEHLYKELLDALNNQNARKFSELFTHDGEIIGFDGSHSVGADEIYSHIKPIFVHHQTAKFISKVKSISLLSPSVALLRAIAGMVPVGQLDINPNVNTHHTVVAVKEEGGWTIRLFQNTPAQFHGRPELVEEMTEELRQLIR